MCLALLGRRPNGNGLVSEQVGPFRGRFARPSSFLETVTGEASDARDADGDIVDRKEHLAEPKPKPALKHAQNEYGAVQRRTCRREINPDDEKAFFQ